jgi:hypothetical protein
LRAKVIVGGGLSILCLILPGSARAGGAFICPNKDLAGRSLADQSFGTTIFCSYGNGFSCIYNTTTGDLQTDNDGGNCPANAVADIVPRPNGAGCTDPGQCASTFCVDGVCCDAACNQPLQQCNLPGHVGTCSSAAAPAPALTAWGLMVAAILLVSFGAFALRHRMRRH